MFYLFLWRELYGSSNLSTVLLLWGIYIKKCISPVRICLQTQNARNASAKFWKTSEVKDLVKYSAYAECEIIHFVNCEILLLRRNVKWNLPTFASANISHLRSKYFTASLFHMAKPYFTCPKGKFRWKKHLLAQVLFSGWDSWIRTSENARVKVWCLTAWLYPNL